MSSVDKHHAVYRQYSNRPNGLITIRDVEKELREQHTRGDIKAGGLYCSDKCLMTFVICSDKSNHFRHVSLVGPKTPRTITSSTQPPPVQCGCSSKHLDAQALLRDHDYKTQPVAFKEWRNCKQSDCCKTVYTATGTGDLKVLLEVREYGGKFVSDVVYYEDGEARMRVEVLATHKADRVRRAGTKFVEVSADHVVASFKKVKGCIVLRCEDSCTGKHEVCLRCAEQRQLEHRQAAAAREAARAEEQRRFWLARASAQQAKFREDRRRADQKRAALDAERERERLDFEVQKRERARAHAAAERDRIAALEARAAAAAAAAQEAARAEAKAAAAQREAKRDQDAASTAEAMAVTPKIMSITLSTDVPPMSHEETEKRRRERMEREAREAARKAQAKRAWRDRAGRAGLLPAQHPNRAGLRPAQHPNRAGLRPAQHPNPY